MRQLRFLLFAAGLTLLAAGACHADTPAADPIKAIAKLGDPVGGTRIRGNGHFEMGALNDNGQMMCVTENAAGGEMLLQYADGKLNLVVVAGGDAPGGQWSKDVGIRSPVNMNSHGEAVFAANAIVGGLLDTGTFLWSYQTQQLSAVALKGMPAVHHLIFEAGGGTSPVINRYHELALVGQVKNAAGKPQTAVFFRDQEGDFLPVALPDQGLPDGGKVLQAAQPAINDAGMVAFLAQRLGQSMPSAYVWEQGEVTPVALVGQKAPGGERFAAVGGVWLNDQDRSVLVEALCVDSSAQGFEALYRFANGRLTRLLAKGQPMPGGGKLSFIQGRKSSLIQQPLAISTGNDTGEHAFLATLDDNSTGLYRLDAGGNLSLILRSGATTALGRITNVGQGSGRSFGVGLNNKGQVALTVGIAGAPDTLIRLTPDAAVAAAGSAGGSEGSVTGGSTGGTTGGKTPGSTQAPTTKLAAGTGSAPAAPGGQSVPPRPHFRYGRIVLPALPGDPYAPGLVRSPHLLMPYRYGRLFPRTTPGQVSDDIGPALAASQGQSVQNQ